jgi:hypothetical protein
MKPPIELPPPVLDLLSVGGAVKLTTGGGRTTDAWVAPIHLALHVLVPARSPALGDVAADGRAEFLAEDRTRETLIRVKARATPGRPVTGEPRRSELLHWLPEGANPAAFAVIHLYPDYLEFTRADAGNRTRASGPIPGSALPPPVRVWSELALRLIWPWVPFLAALDWVYVLFSREATAGRWVLLAVSVVASLLLLAACGLFAEWARYTRWREGIGQRPAGRLAEGWAGVDQVLTGAKVALGAGLLLVLALGVTSGADLAGWVVLASGAWALAPAYGIRHWFRRSDAAEGTAS